MDPSLKITNEYNGERLDVVLARLYPDYSRVFLQKMVRQGAVTLGKSIPKPSYRVRMGETLQISDFNEIPPPPLRGRIEVGGASLSKTPHPHLPPQGGKGLLIPRILFEDDFLLVIDKPAGLVVHPARGHREGTLIDWLRDYLGPKVCNVFTDSSRLGLVHRLDKDTSGVLLTAKTIPAQTALSRQFRERQAQKTYVAFVEGVPSARKGIISAPVGRSRRYPTRMTVSAAGRPSETSFEVNEAFKEVAQMTLYPKTGRTHQIRVHLSAIGHPIVGDQTYGSRSLWSQTYGIKRGLLHAERLGVTHPERGKSLIFRAPWPEDFKQAQQCFRRIFGVALLALILKSGGTPLYAQETSATPAKNDATTPQASSSHAAKSSLTASQWRKLRKEVQALHEQMVALSRQVNTLQASLEQLNGSRRLHDLEHAVSELNGKGAASANAAEETKTQVLGINRKLKNQEEGVEQLRDQIDRLQREWIEWKTRQESSMAPAKPAKK